MVKEKRVGGEKELGVQIKNHINPIWCQGPVRVDEFVLQVNPRRRIGAGNNSSDGQIRGAFMVASIEVFRDGTLFRILLAVPLDTDTTNS